MVEHCGFIWQCWSAMPDRLEAGEVVFTLELDGQRVYISHPALSAAQAKGVEFMVHRRADFGHGAQRFDVGDLAPGVLDCHDPRDDVAIFTHPVDPRATVAFNKGWVDGQEAGGAPKAVVHVAQISDPDIHTQFHQQRLSTSEAEYLQSEYRRGWLLGWTRRQVEEWTPDQLARRLKALGLDIETAPTPPGDWPANEMRDSLPAAEPIPWPPGTEETERHDVRELAFKAGARARSEGCPESFASKTWMVQRNETLLRLREQRQGVLVRLFLEAWEDGWCSVTPEAYAPTDGDPT